MSNSLKLAPFHPVTGDLLHYDSGKHMVSDWKDPNRQYADTDYRPNLPFIARMQLVDMQTGRSAKYVRWQLVDDLLQRDGRFPHYSMFISDLIDLLHNGVIQNGWTAKTWIIRKRGANYGLARYTR